MIRCYAWTTPNGFKIPIALEELGLEWQLQRVDIGKGEQFAPGYLAINPNNKIPAIVDEEAGNLAVFESGAILQYLAEKTGRLLAPSGPARWAALEWLHWQVGGLGPMLGQLGFFKGHAAEAPLAFDRFTKEGERLLGVLERRLAQGAWLAGDDFSIADIAAFTWTRSSRQRLAEPLAQAIADAPATTRWLEAIEARPAVQRGLAAFG